MCVEYIPRCVKYLYYDNLSSLLYSILLGKSIIINGPSPLFDDITKLVRAVSIIDMSPQDQRGDDSIDDINNSSSSANNITNDDDVWKLVITCSESDAAYSIRYVPPAHW